MSRARGTQHLRCLAPSKSRPGQTCRFPLGEATEPLRWAGAFVQYRERQEGPEPPRDIRRCIKCGRYNIFLPLHENGRGHGIPAAPGSPGQDVTPGQRPIQPPGR